MKKSLSLIAATLLASSMMVACSGGGDDAVAAATYNGKFVDSGVEGITWTCPPATGTTGVGGVFGECAVGTPVTFTLGNINLGTITDTSAFGDANKTIITPTILEQASGQTDVATKIAVTLQSLDSDGDPTNGITIDAATIAAVNGQPAVDLTDSNVTIADTEAAASTIVADVISTTGTTTMSPVDAATANAHLKDTQDDIDDGTITPTEQPGDTPVPTGGSN